MRVRRTDKAVTWRRRCHFRIGIDEVKARPELASPRKKKHICRSNEIRRDTKFKGLSPPWAWHSCMLEDFQRRNSVKRQLLKFLSFQKPYRNTTVRRANGLQVKLIKLSSESDLL